MDELGLVGATRQHAATLHSASGIPLAVAVETSNPLPTASPRCVNAQRGSAEGFGPEAPSGWLVEATIPVGPTD